LPQRLDVELGHSQYRERWRPGQWSACDIS
jgi:hypothetical protein